jgi:hypothetical protein
MCLRAGGEICEGDLDEKRRHMSKASSHSLRGKCNIAIFSSSVYLKWPESVTQGCFKISKSLIHSSSA